MERRGVDLPRKPVLPDYGKARIHADWWKLGKSRDHDCYSFSKTRSNFVSSSKEEAGGDGRGWMATSVIVGHCKVSSTDDEYLMLFILRSGWDKAGLFFTLLYCVSL